MLQIYTTITDQPTVVQLLLGPHPRSAESRNTNGLRGPADVDARAACSRRGVRNLPREQSYPAKLSPRPRPRLFCGHPVPRRGRCREASESGEWAAESGSQPFTHGRFRGSPWPPGETPGARSAETPGVGPKSCAGRWQHRQTIQNECGAAIAPPPCTPRSRLRESGTEKSPSQRACAVGLVALALAPERQSKALGPLQEFAAAQQVVRFLGCCCRRARARQPLTW